MNVSPFADTSADVVEVTKDVAFAVVTLVLIVVVEVADVVADAANESTSVDADPLGVIVVVVVLATPAFFPALALLLLLAVALSLSPTSSSILAAPHIISYKQNPRFLPFNLRRTIRQQNTNAYRDAWLYLVMLCFE